MHGQDVAAIRKKLEMSQAEFARQFRINLHTLRQWERKNNQLDSATSAYVTCIGNDAEAVAACLGSSAEDA